MANYEAMTSIRLANVLQQDYYDRVQFDSVDHDTALFDAVNWTARNYNDEYKADLYARLLTVFPTSFGDYSVLLSEVHEWLTT